MTIKRHILNIAFFTLAFFTIAFMLTVVIDLSIDDFVNPPKEGGLESIGNLFAIVFVGFISFSIISKGGDLHESRIRCKISK